MTVLVERHGFVHERWKNSRTPNSRAIKTNQVRVNISIFANLLLRYFRVEFSAEFFYRAEVPRSFIFQRTFFFFFPTLCIRTISKENKNWTVSKTSAFTEKFLTKSFNILDPKLTTSGIFNISMFSLDQLK